MSLVIFSTICSLVIIYFAVMPKNLNTLELALIMILVIYLDSNVMDIVMLNLKSIKLSDKLAGIVTFYLTFLVLYPLVLAWNIDRLYSTHHKSVKIGLSLFTILLIAGLESLTKIVNAVNYVNWNWQKDIVQWVIIWLISFGSHLLFRKLVLKELKQ
ncbi:hypothetical protein [Bacillus sp. X1(2014)]|uniref:hypothetical protein n=1 Tax=Bacillus sp. X1(2014) TaxID=1565991 RepID=UPI0011A12A8D|nr:hypothetical protein [Bacillus sp. X1(2014)]